MSDQRDVILDLDHLTREDLDPNYKADRPPFTFTWKGRTLTFKDPTTLPHDQALSVERPIQFLRYVLDQEDKDHLNQNAMEMWMLRAVMERYVRHYELDQLPGGQNLGKL